MKKNRGIIYAVVTVIMFATTGLLAKLIYNYQLDGEIVFFISSLLSSLVLLGILLQKYRQWGSLKISKKDLLVSFGLVGPVGLYLSNIFVLKALQYMDTGLQKIITYSNPLFTIAIYQVLFHKKPSSNELCSMILIVAGLLLIISGINFTHQRNILMGIYFSLLGGLASSIRAIITDKYKIEINITIFCFYAFLGATVFSTLGLLLHKNLHWISQLVNGGITLLVLLVLCAILNFCLPYLFLFQATKLMGAVKTGLILLSTPVLTIILGIWIFREKISTSQMLGTGLILTSSLVATKINNTPVPDSSENQKQLSALV
jgi:drug/metabolite transporter (DMT)-like permease